MSEQNFKRNVYYYCDEDSVSLRRISERFGRQSDYFDYFVKQSDNANYKLPMQVVNDLCFYLRCEPWQLFTDEPVKRISRISLKPASIAVQMRKSFTRHFRPLRSSYAKVSEEAGVTVDLYQDYIDKGQVPPYKMINALAVYFKTDVADMIRGELDEE